MSSSSISDQSSQFGTSTREEDKKKFLGEENEISFYEINLVVILSGVQKEPS